MITLKKKFSDSYNFIFNKVVILRVDLNVPIDENEITDTTRIIKIIPTIEKLLNHKAKILLITHRGRPGGKWLDELSLEIIVNKLQELSSKKIYFMKNNIKSLNKSDLLDKFNKNDIIVLENIRFYPDEEKFDEKFSKKISSLADIFINECFSCSHRNHSSISGVPKFLPSFPGELLEKEIANLKNLFLVQNQTDGIAVIGGSKISTKIKLVSFYADKFSKVLIGGAMANTLNLAQGYEIGTSMCEKRMIKISDEILKQFSDKIILPEDFIVTDKKFLKNPEAKLKSQIGKNDYIVDIGPQTRMLFYKEIINTNTVLWNGPLGLFEKSPFNEGTEFVLNAIKGNKNKNFFSVAGGGDTISILNQSNCFKDFNFVSTGGGAFLEFVQGTNMPGLTSLND